MSKISSKIIVIKLGSSSLTAERTGLAYEKLARYVRLTCELIEAGYSPVIVSSGAVAAGAKALGLKSKPKVLDEIQACAAVGQGLLMESYSNFFNSYGVKVGQVLLTRRDFTVKESYNNAFSTFKALIEFGAVPIVNENDVVKIKSYSFGDNDRLASLVSAFLHAEILILLTDTDGLYDKDPKKHSAAKKISFVENLTPEILSLGNASGSDVGTGGMASKLRAAQVALSVGVRAYIGSSEADSFKSIVNDSGTGTYFGKKIKDSFRKKLQWIAFHSDIAGSIIIDSGAKNALLKNGKSLLPAGVVSFEGEFKDGDIVEVKDERGDFLGRGLVNYSSEDLLKSIGKSSAFVKEKLMVKKIEVIHRDDWVFI